MTIESLGPQGAAARAGLRTGDVLLSWRRGDAGGKLLSCADLTAVEMEQAPHGPVVLRVERQEERRDKKLSLELAPDDWQVEVVPRQAGAAGETRETGEIGCAAFARARRLGRSRTWPAARAAYGEAAQAAGARKSILFAALALQEQGTAALNAGDFPAAEKVYAEALAARRQAAPGGLAEAASWHLFGRLHLTRGELTAAREAFRRALQIRQRLAPQSLATASTLNNLGIEAWKRGDRDTARTFYTRSLSIVHETAPGSLDEAMVVNNLGLISRDLGNAAQAQREFTAAGRIWQRLDPEGLDLARNDLNLGLLAADRGDLAGSDQLLRRALARFEKIDPEGLGVAAVLNNLGITARDRYSLTEADVFFRRSLAIRHRLVPGSQEEAESLSNLAWIARERDRLDEAEDFGRRALALRMRQAPDSPSVALSLGILGAIAGMRGDLRRAEELGQQALALERRAAPGSLPESQYLLFLGGLALERGEPRRAEPLLRQSLAIRRRIAPGSAKEGATLHFLGRAEERLGRLREAEDSYAKAVATVEAASEQAGGSDETRSTFLERYAEIYRDLLALQLKRGKTAEALQTLERSRARALLALLAERDLTFDADIPAALLQRQQRLDHEYETTQQALARLDPRHAAEIDALLATLARLRSERSALSARIAQASPRYASLRSPRPLDLAGIRAVLDPGTVWLSYCVGDERTLLFVVTPAGKPGGKPDGAGVTVHTLPIGRKALEDEVSIFRSLILRGREAARPAVREPALLAAGSRLYGLLLAPAAAEIARADRVLLSPDGPLHILPFAALAHGKPAVFLAEEKPWHTVLSATLYGEIRRGRRGRLPGAQAAAGPLVAFADPQVQTPAPGSRDNPAEPPVRRYRNGLQPLPGAREEVRALGSLWGADAHIYTGAAASEQRLRELPVRPRYLHFACHALLDRRYPLDSALALATPGRSGAEGLGETRDNGLLQAWEIFERLRLDSELVTLSACETGLGREAGGEGLIGLTRAFQYAGARSVLASLWSVSDRTTAQLMERFYALLRAGRPKDLALQEAQRALLRTGGDAAQPVHWAAFTLSGDWQ